MELSKPVFSSPAVDEVGVYVGCVDGGLYCFSHHGVMVMSALCVLLKNILQFMLMSVLISDVAVYNYRAYIFITSYCTLH